MSQKPEVVSVAPLPAFVREPLYARFQVHDYAGAADKPALLKAAVNARGMLCFGGSKVTPAELDQLPNLEVISVFGVGYDGVPTDYCKRRGIKVTNTPGVLSDEVADLAMALMLNVSRQMVEAHKFTERGDWMKGAYPLVRSVHHKRVGIIGLGRIGATIAKRCQGFDMQVSYHGRRKQDVPFTFYPNLVEMAKNVDFLVVITPGGADTQHLVNAEVLAALGKTGVLINVARGSVVDEAALIKAIETGTIGGAGLDVFDKEPCTPSALANRPNVVLAPHVASGTIETRQAMCDLSIANLDAHFAGKPVLTLVPELA